MVRVAPAAIALYLRFSTELVKGAAVALVLGALLAATEQHTNLPRGFQCIPASDLPAADILAFAQGLQNRTEELSGAQLSCLARLLAAKNLTDDFGKYPPDLLLFFDLAKVRGGTCGEFYTRASRGNLELLPRGSARRMGLLRGALACLGVRSSRLGPEQLGSLGALVCDMEPETITASDPGILENLKLCPALTGTQRDALNAVLLRGGTEYGDPPSWDLQTLQNLGPLVLALNQTTLSLVAKAAREAFGRNIVATYGSQGPSQREKSLTLLRAFSTPSASSHPRLKRSFTDRCLSVPITASTISNPYLILDYDTREQFELCLSNEVLKANLELLLQQPLPKDYHLVVKKKLEQIYPSGIPEKELKLLGPLFYLYPAEEISTWTVTSKDTLLALLSPSYSKPGAPQVQQLFSRYLALGGTLTGPLLQKIGEENLCNLLEEQIEQIPPEAIRTGQLSISSCSQTKKDQLYIKAQEAFADQAGTPRAYYCQIRPYLGGAPAEDLKDLAEAGVTIDMDMDTFLALNPEELQKLSVVDVKNLLGKNLLSLKEAENEPSVMRWVKRQSQRELDCILGIGLQGGMVEPTLAGTTTPPHPTVPPTATIPVPTTLPTVPTPVDVSSHPTTNASTGSSKVPTPSLGPLNSTAPHPAPGTAATSTARPAPTTTSTIAPCSTRQPDTPAATTLLTTILAPVNPNATSPSSIPPPALTGEATATTSVVITRNGSIPLVSMNPPALGGTTHPAPTTITLSTHNTPSTLVPNSTSPLVSRSAPAPGGSTHPAPTTHSTITVSTHTTPGTLVLNSTSPLVSISSPAPGGSTHSTPTTHNTITLSTHNAPGTLVPNSTSAPTTTPTEINLPPHKPTPISNSTVSTQKSVVSSTAKTTTLACKTPPAFLGPFTTTTSSETTKETTKGVPASPRPTSNGYINLKPEAGSGSRVSSCLVPALTVAVGASLLRGLL